MKFKFLAILSATCIAGFSISACTGEPEIDAPQTTEHQQVTTLPPGFLDEPPAPPTSNTQVLSGGTMVLGADATELTTDSVIVISNGQLLAWGARGAVAMPNDSVGYDMRGKWIVPGRWAEISAGTRPADLVVGEPVNLLILDRPPPFSEVQEDELAGRIVDGVLELFGES